MLMPGELSIKTDGLSDKTKGILTGIISTAIILGGLVVGFNTKDRPKLTYDEAQKLIKIYNYELSQTQNKQFQQITKDNITQKLQDRFQTRIVNSDATIGEEKISPDTYNILRSGLFEKAKQ